MYIAVNSQQPVESPMFKRITLNRRLAKSIQPASYAFFIILFVIIFAFFFIAIGNWRIV